MSDGEPWGWFDEMEEVVGECEGGGGAPAATPVTKPTPPYILTVRKQKRDTRDRLVAVLPVPCAVLCCAP